jgi:hypothetical protein
MRDVQKFEKCDADTMLQGLLARCTDSSQSLSANEISTLLDTSLEAVLPICNGETAGSEIKKYLIEL